MKSALGPRTIEVRVTGGVVHLSGRVLSDEEAQRLIRLVRSIAGVTDVRSNVLVGPPEPATSGGRPLTGGESMESQGDRRLFAVGGSVSWINPRNRDLGAGVAAGLLVRVGSGSGLAPAFGLNWFKADLDAGPNRLARIRVRPIMGGVGYTVRHDRIAVAPSLVAGWAFNSLAVDDLVTDDRLPLKVDNSLVWRPGVAMWFDLNRRFAFNVFVGYLVVRPSVMWLEDGRITKRSLRADTVVVSTGVAYKLF